MCELDTTLPSLGHISWSSACACSTGEHGPRSVTTTPIVCELQPLHPEPGRIPEIPKHASDNIWVAGQMLIPGCGPPKPHFTPQSLLATLSPSGPRPPPKDG